MLHCTLCHCYIPQEVYDLALLFNMCTQEGPKKHVDYHSIGNVYLSNEIASHKKRTNCI